VAEPSPEDKAEAYQCPPATGLPDLLFTQFCLRFDADYYENDSAPILTWPSAQLLPKVE
jgi:hypothetical protein